MAEVRVGHADALHDGQLLLVELLLKEPEVRVQTDTRDTFKSKGRVHRTRFVRGTDGNVGTVVVVLALTKRHDGVQTIIAASEIDHEQDALVLTDRGHRGCHSARQERRGRGYAGATGDGLQEAATRQVQIAVRAAEVAQRVVGADVGMEHGEPF